MLALPAVITHDEAPDCLQRLSAQLATKAGPLRVDCSGLIRFDSSAVAVLLGLRREALRLGQTVVFEHWPPRLAQLATVYGVAEWLMAETGADTVAPQALSGASGD